MEINIRAFSTGDDFCNLMSELIEVALSYQSLGFPPSIREASRKVYVNIAEKSNKFGVEKIDAWYLQGKSWALPHHWGQEAFAFFVQFAQELESQDHLLKMPAVADKLHGFTFGSIALTEDSVEQVYLFGNTDD